MKENIVLPLCLLLVSIGSIAYLTYNQINSAKALRALSNEYKNYNPPQEIDLNDPLIRKRLQQRIKHYESIERNPVMHLSQIEDEETRKLASSNIFDDVGLVDPIESGHSSLSKWIARNIKLYSPEVVAYPYAFNYNFEHEGETVDKHYTQGAFIALNPSTLDAYNIGLKTNNTVNVKKARALYDQDIAILSIEYQVTDYQEDLFQDAVDWCTYFQSTLGKGTCYPTLDDFMKNKKTNPSKAYVTKLNVTDIITGKLLNEDGLPRFGTLVIPDFKLGVDSIIVTLLTGIGTKNIVNFYNAGGSIIVAGKSGYLLEVLGLISAGSYDTSKLFSSDTTNRQIKIQGCEKAVDKAFDANTDDFNTQLLCVGITENTRPALSTTFRMLKKDSSFSVLLSIDPTYGDLIYTDTNSGIPSDLSDSDKKFTPLILNKSNSKGGQIFILNFNPVYASGNKNILFNLLVLALSKEMYMSSKVNMDVNSTAVPDLPIPAGEAGVELEVNTLFHNLNDKAINNFKMYIFLPENFGWSDKGIPSTCTKKKIGSETIPKNILNKRSFETTNDYLVCTESAINAYEKRNFKLTIDVLNYKATQAKYEILILEPIVSYTDSKNKENIMVEYVRVSAEAAPVLRVAINPDPSSFYPVEGRGQYVDNVVKIENKEESDAFDVEYVGLIPLISPLTDGDDQRVLRWNLRIYVDYYNTLNDFEVPFTSTAAVDYIFTAKIQGKGARMVAEWDSPVLPVKEIYNGDGIGQEPNIDGISQGMITITSTTEVLKQINYRNADRFYKLASQRLMVFVDTSTPEGMKALYGSYDKVPSEWKDPVLKDRCKKEFIFTRSDIYFYENENYCNPLGIKEKHVFSIDKYKAYTKNASGCVQKRGEAHSKVLVPGYFNNRDSDKRSTILKPAEWSNEMFQYCDLTIVDPTSEASIKSVFGSTDNLRPVHYTVPNVEPSVTQPGQIYGFEQTDAYHGYMKDYPSVKFIYVHSLTYVIPTARCLYGGMIEINLGTNFNLKSLDDVTLSPDQIAFYETTYENHVIKAYFKRGLMSNEQFGKDMTITINIENLPSTTAQTFKVTLYNSKYDISYPPNYERFYKYETKDYTFNYVSVFSYPALELKTQLNRTLGGYETMEPFSRYGVYIQEVGHRTVFGTAETHHQTNPGMTGNGEGFSMISNLGISSIPFLEYVTAGSGQVIPAGTSTSRAKWKDIWGRTWNQPLRTVFPDVPPIPPPLKNFMMTTTYEILKGGKQVYEWNSDEKVQIHLHVKLLNNYPKYFEITRCKENQIRFVPEKLAEEHSRIYANTCSADLLSSELNGDRMFLSKGGYASYGKCFLDDKAIVGGKKMDSDFKKELEQAILCADSTQSKEVKECEEKLEGITTLHKMPDSFDSTQTWNYSPLVESYYPKGYIEEDMWQLTHVDYDDNAMDKAYKYHMDNWVPNLDNAIIKPHNTIAIPIYKGLGYDISYSKDNSMNYHGVTKKGWWSDDLQNKDDTLVAGQETCNNISVDKKCSIKEWVEYKSLVGSKRAGSNDKVKAMDEARIKNIYVCLYNRKRPIHQAENSRTYYTKNVNQNNIVPVIVSLDKDDPRLTNYDCKEEQYTPDNLYTMVDNYLATPTDKDYLYFAANLRGQAKESFNVLMNLSPFDKIKYEGMVKVNEGGRFVYWNPANGPNSFLIVDDPVSIVNAKRNDIEIENEIFPLRTTTFNAVVYHLYTFYDENKINKEWPFTSYYANSYGFGDVSISVYAGRVRNSNAVLQPGETTYVKIVINNNCGFDWNMLGNAIDFKYVDTKPISANDLLHRLTHTIQAPLKYNFLNYTVDPVYANYITIVPSDHNIEVAPEFFDFENINVVTIRDGFKGEYFLKITLSKNFPENLRGKPIEIKIDILPEYFDHFPGTASDPIKSYHPYTVKIPSVYIACPFKSGEFEGKVLYTSAQATVNDMVFNLGIDWKVDGVKYIDEDNIEKLREASSEEEFNKQLLKVYESLPGPTLAFQEKANGETKTVSITGIPKDYPLFPKTNVGAPDVAKISFIVKSTVDQLKYGYTYPITDVKMHYKDWSSKDKVANGEKPQLYAEGAWLELTYTRTLVDEFTPGVYVDMPNQEIDLTEEGIMKVQFKLTNVGNGICYKTKYEIVVQPNLTYIGDVSGKHTIKSKVNNKGQTLLEFDYGTPINPGELKGGMIYLRFKKYMDSYDGLTEEDILKLPTQLKIVDSASAQIELTNITGEVQVTQHLRKQLNMDYSKKDKTFVYAELTLTGRRSSPVATINPLIKYVAGETEDDVEVTVAKVDLTNYGQYYSKALRFLLTEVDEDPVKFNTTYLYFKQKPRKARDEPCAKQKTQTNHIVLYSATLYNKKTKITSAAYVKYEQEKVGLSIYEYIFILVSIVLYSLAALFIWLTVKNLRLIKAGGMMSKVKNTKLDRLLA